MKNLLSLLLVCFFISCTNNDDDNSQSERFCREVEVSGELRKLYIGPRDGCYYYNVNGNKTYVERELCKC